MTKILKQTVYQNAMPSADTSGVMFIVDGHMHIFQMTPLEMKRLARQIEDAHKKPTPTGSSG